MEALGQIFRLYKSLNADARIHGYKILLLAATDEMEAPVGVIFCKFQECVRQPEYILSGYELAHEQERPGPCCQGRPTVKQSRIGAKHAGPDSISRHAEPAHQSNALAARDEHSIEVRAVLKPESHRTKHELA